MTGSSLRTSFQKKSNQRWKPRLNDSLCFSAEECQCFTRTFKSVFPIYSNSVVLWGVLTFFSSSCLSQNTEKVDFLVNAVKAHRSYTNMVSVDGTEAGRRSRRLVIVFVFLTVDPMCRPKPAKTAFTNKCCVCVEVWCIFFLFAIKNLFVSPAVALGDKFLLYHEHNEHTQCSLFELNPKYTILLLQTLNRAANINEYTAEKNTQ